MLQTCEARSSSPGELEERPLMFLVPRGAGDEAGAETALAREEALRSTPLADTLAIFRNDGDLALHRTNTLFWLGHLDRHRSGHARYPLPPPSLQYLLAKSVMPH